jgi:hypothetical protein
MGCDGCRCNLRARVSIIGVETFVHSSVGYDCPTIDISFPSFCCCGDVDVL